MAKHSHSFRVTVTAIGPETDAAPPLSFDHINHDDILLLVERAQGGLLGPDDAAPVILGVKLLGQVMLERKDDPLFDPLRGALREFIVRLKSLHKRTTAPSNHPSA